MKIKVDENLPREVADLFRTTGHDAMTVGDQQLDGMPDTTIGFALQQEARALVTFDLGFADVRRHPPVEYDGLVVSRLRRQTKPHVLDVIGRLLPIFTTETLGGRPWIVAEGQIRVRRAL
jgi:hypothetical protein